MDRIAPACGEFQRSTGKAVPLLRRLICVADPAAKKEIPGGQGLSLPGGIQLPFQDGKGVRLDRDVPAESPSTW
jgi:hypothetical protein